jgi:O-antigen ligase
MLENLILFFCFFLPFQFALDPYPGVDLAIARVFSLLIFLFWIIGKKFRLNFKQYSDRVSLLFFLFLAIAVLSVFLSPNAVWSLRKLAFLFSFAPLYPVLRDVAKDEKMRINIIKALLFGALLVAAVGILQFFSQFVFGIDAIYSFWSRYVIPFFLGQTFSQAVLAYPSWLVNSGGITYMRAFATFPDPHMFSYYMGMLFPWAILFACTSKKNRRLFVFISVFLLLADLLSFTRGGYIALFFGGLVTLPLVTRKTAAKIALSMATILVLFFFVPNNPVGPRLVSSFDVKEGSNQGRISNWGQAFHVIALHPLGTGIGAYSLAVDPSAAYREPIYAHDLYLDIAAELGILGIAIFVSLLSAVFISYWKGSENNVFWIAGCCSIAIFCTHSFVESPLYSVQILPLLIIMITLSTYAHPSEKIISD